MRVLEVEVLQEMTIQQEMEQQTLVVAVVELEVVLRMVQKAVEQVVQV